MSLLSHTALLALLEQGVIENAVPECVNAASLDIRLGRYLHLEAKPTLADLVNPLHALSLKDRDPVRTVVWDLVEQGDYIVKPGEFLLAQSFEVFNLPNNIAAEYKLKSSLARIGLDHLNAGWCDPGWNGSVLTLELRNLTTYHPIKLSYLDKIGQMIFFRCAKVPVEGSYATKGRYNGDKKVQGAKK